MYNFLRPSNFALNFKKSLGIDTIMNYFLIKKCIVLSLIAFILKYSVDFVLSKYAKPWNYNTNRNKT